MGRHQHLVVPVERSENAVLPIGYDTLHGILQRFGTRQHPGRHLAVTDIEPGIAGVVVGERVGCDIVTAAPQEHLFAAVLAGRLLFIEPLQDTVVLLVQLPALLHGNPVEVHHIECIIERLDGAFQIGGERHSETEAGLAHHAARPFGLFHPVFRQVHIGPARKPVLLVPNALAVAEQNYPFHIRCNSNPGPETGANPVRELHL